MTKKIILVLLALLLLGAAGFHLFVKHKIAQKKAEMMQAMAGRVAEVTVTTAKKESVQTYRELPARVNSYRIAEVRPQAEGIIREKKFEEGSLVKQGDQLYQIDSTMYDIALKNTKASYDRMRARLERYRQLLKEDAISQQDYEDSRADFAKAEADYNTAVTNSNYSKILAPISGFVGKSNITEGALVTLNQTTVLTTITQLDPIYVDMIQPSKESVNSPAQKDMTVSILVDGEKYPQEGKLKLIEKFADESTDSVRLRSEFSNPDNRLIPGMFVTARLHLPLFDSITIPQRATMRLPGGALMIFVVENGVAKQRIIKATQMIDDRFIVSEGLQEGEQVVIEGIQKIGDGVPVKIAQAAPNAAPPANQDKK